MKTTKTVKQLEREGPGCSPLMRAYNQLMEQFGPLIRKELDRTSREFKRELARAKAREKRAGNGNGRNGRAAACRGDGQ